MAFPATYNFNYYSGDTFQFLVYPKDSQGGVFDDLSGYTPRFTIAPSRGATPTLDSDDEELVITVSPENDHLICEILASSGPLLTQQSYVYDVEIRSGGGSKVYTLVTGTITVTQDVAG